MSYLGTADDDYDNVHVLLWEIILFSSFRPDIQSHFRGREGLGFTGRCGSSRDEMR